MHEATFPLDDRDGELPANVGSAPQLASSSSSALEPQLQLASQPAGQRASEPADFAALIERLEGRVGDTLVDPGRQWCLDAFLRWPTGFTECASRALERGRSPVRLLVKMVRSGDPEKLEQKLAGRQNLEPVDDDREARARAWLEKTGRLFADDDRIDVLRDFGLSDEQIERVWARWTEARS